MADENEVSKLKQQITIKQLEINALLDVTQAINRYQSAEDLYRIYRLVLQGQMGLAKMAAFVMNGGWECVLTYGVSEDIKSLDVEDKFGAYKELTDIRELGDKDLEVFEHIIPVYDDDKPLAYLLIGGVQGDSSAFNEKINFIRTITNIILVAIENKKLIENQIEQEKMQKELELAKQVQSMLIPEKLPNNHRIHMSAFYLPHKEVGGDYYDCIMLNEEEVAFCVADISGKGIAAALLMANFQANLRAMLKQQLSLKSLVASLNEAVNKITRGEKFITFFLAKINLVSNRMIYINAGHNPPLLCSAGKVEQLHKGSTILGMFEHLPSVETGTVDLEDGSMIFCYTDGVTDLEDERGEMYETDRLEDFIKENYQLNPKEFNDSLEAHISEFKGDRPYVDDVTFLTTKFTN